jgi:hypothetical protein
MMTEQADIGNLTYGIRSNAADLVDACGEESALDRIGDREIRDLLDAVADIHKIMSQLLARRGP